MFPRHPKQCNNFQLHDQGKSSKDTGEDRSQTVAPSDIQCRNGTALLSRSGSCRRCTTNPGENLSSCTSGSTPCRCRCHCARDRSVDSNWILSSARMIAPARGLAISVSITAGHALGSVLGADKVWEGLGEFGGVGCYSVAANAAEFQRILAGVSPRFFCGIVYTYSVAIIRGSCS